MWWRIGRFNTFRLKGRGFVSCSTHHVGILNKCDSDYDITFTWRQVTFPSTTAVQATTSLLWSCLMKTLHQLLLSQTTNEVVAKALYVDISTKKLIRMSKHMNVCIHVMLYLVHIQEVTNTPVLYKNLQHSFIHSFILSIYSASSRELLRGTPDSSTAKKSSLKLRKNAGDKALGKILSWEGSPFQIEGPTTEKARFCLAEVRAKGTRRRPCWDEMRW